MAFTLRNSILTYRTTRTRRAVPSFLYQCKRVLEVFSRVGQSSQLEKFQKLFCTARRIFPACAHFFDRRQCGQLMQLQLVHDELIGMQRLDVIPGKDCGGKILQVESDDAVGMTAIAAASTCRSSLSGNSSPAINGW